MPSDRAVREDKLSAWERAAKDTGPSGRSISVKVTQEPEQ